MKTRHYLVGALAPWFMMAAANAQDGAGIPVGSMQFYPSVTLGVGHNDNLTEANTNEIDSTFVKLGPVFSLVGEGNKLRAEFRYEGEYADYQDSSADNYDDHRLLHVSDLTLSDRQRLGFELDYQQGHDSRGSTDLALPPTPNEWETYGAKARFGYGAMSAKGRIEAEAAYVDKEYTNNRSITVTQDKDVGSLRGTFFWRLGGRTEALLEALYSDIDYTLPTSFQDNTLTTYNAGVKWEATGKTTGQARVGYTEKDFDSNQVSDYDTLSWDVGVTWSPRTYSSVDLVTRRTVEDSTGQGTSLDIARYEVAWNHDWRARFSTRVSGAYEDVDYNDDPREDDNYEFGLRGAYEMRRWLDISASWQYNEGDSNQDANDFEQNVFLLELTATL